jgi:transcription elongation factor Elf1
MVNFRKDYMQTQVTDPLCNSGKVELFARKGKRSYYKCLKCGSVFLFPEPSLKELEAYYSAMPDNYLMAMEQSYSNSIKFKFLFDHYLQKYAKKKNGILVDVGCFTGDFLEICKTKDFKQTYGYEINKKAIQVLKNKGINTIDDLQKLDTQRHQAKAFEITVIRTNQGCFAAKS